VLSEKMQRVFEPGYTSVDSSLGMFAIEQLSVLDMVHVCESNETVGNCSAC
jgi:hypothetical protein